MAAKQIGGRPLSAQGRSSSHGLLISASDPVTSSDRPRRGSATAAQITRDVGLDFRSVGLRRSYRLHAPPREPGVAAPNTLVGRRPGNITSAHGSMNHVAINVAPEDIDSYREALIAKGVDVTPVVNHDDVVTGKDARTSAEITDRTWLRSCYFFDPDGIMLELCATVNEGSPDVDLPVNAEGIKADGSRITGA